MPKAEIIPSVVIYIEDGEIRLVQSDVPLTVYLVDYDVASIEDAVVIDDPQHPDDPDYVYISELSAEVDEKAVESVVNMYYDNYEIDTDDRAVIRKE